MNTITKLRESRNLKQKELANILKISPQALSGYENGYREPDYDILCRIADFFGVTTDYLLHREPDSGYVYSQKDSELTKDEIELLTIYRSIVPELRQNARSMIDQLPKLSQNNKHTKQAD